MKKILSLLVISAFTVTTFHTISFASITNDATNFDYRDIANYPAASVDRPLSFAGFLTVYFNSIAAYEGVPDSYRYITLNFRNVKPGTPLYVALQKGVYMNFFKNLPIDIKNDTATEDQFARAVESNLGGAIEFEKGKPLTLHKLLSTLEEIYTPHEELPTETGSSTSNESSSPTQQATINIGSLLPITTVSNFPILNDVYVKLRYGHYDSTKFTDEELIRWAAKGMAEATGDKHTAYFAPAASKDFQDSLSGEFEGIGAYVDMPQPGELRIVSPLPGTPAEKAGLKGGDHIVKIDGVDVTESLTLEQAIRKIKWPNGSAVKLLIKRGTQEIEFSVIRAKITISYVEYKKLNNGDHYIKITTFGAGVKDAFVQALQAIAKEGGNSKIIIDLRNDPGGSLDEVAGILDYFVPKDQSSVHIKYKNTTTEMLSSGLSLIDWNTRRIAILINGGSASASEIMAGTIKDYLPSTNIIGEKSYGKGSVQSLDLYPDTSSFKYTIAKWFTGKTRTGIDGTGIKPDTELKFDEEKWKSSAIDNQLEYAKNW